jgi:pimeloyl-ACP methyl ester carboxylesterase
VPFAEVGGIRLHYLDEGAGEPAVVLLHAFPLSSAMWEPQVAALQERWRVVAPDLRGFGRSQVPEDRSAYSMEAFADDVAGLLDHLGLGRVVVVGLSIGGYIAFSLLRRHRPRVAALVLADTRDRPDSPEVAERRTRQQAALSQGGKAAVVDELLAGLAGDSTRRDHPEVVARIRALMEPAAAPALIGALEAMKQRPDASGELYAIGVPTLFVVGDEDAGSPPDVARAMHEEVPGSQLEIVPGAGHVSNLAAPDVFNQALVRFLESL